MAKWRGARPPFPCARLRRLVVVVRCGRSTSAPGSPPLRLLRHRRRVSPGLGLVVFCGGKLSAKAQTIRARLAWVRWFWRYRARERPGFVVRVLSHRAVCRQPEVCGGSRILSVTLAGQITGRR